MENLTIFNQIQELASLDACRESVNNKFLANAIDLYINAEAQKLIECLKGETPEKPA